MKRPKQYTDESGNERNGSDIQDAYERAMEDKAEREREEKELTDEDINNSLNQLS